MADKKIKVESYRVKAVFVQKARKVQIKGYKNGFQTFMRNFRFVLKKK